MEQMHVADDLVPLGSSRPLIHFVSLLRRSLLQVVRSEASGVQYAVVNIRNTLGETHDSLAS